MLLELKKLVKIEFFLKKVIVIREKKDRILFFLLNNIKTDIYYIYT